MFQCWDLLSKMEIYEEKKAHEKNANAVGTLRGKLLKYDLVISNTWYSDHWQ